MRSSTIVISGVLSVFGLAATAGSAWTTEIASPEETAKAYAAAATTTSKGFATIYSLPGAAHGSWPRGGVALDASGNVYGTTFYDGACGNCGVIYKLAKPAAGKTAWTYTVLHYFQEAAEDGIGPTGPLTIVGNKIYGTTSAGANFLCGCGEVFELTPSGSKWTYKILHRFDGPHGTNPIGGVLVAKDGTLYGTTAGGGSQQAGVLYKITPGGAFSVVHNFTGGYGSGPQGELVFGKDGAIYGTTFGEGKYGQGSVFRITTGGAYTVLYDFLGVNQPGNSHDGAQPEGRLALGPDGTIYGTTTFGGTPSGYGTAWSLTPKNAGKTWAYQQLYIFGRDPSQPNLPHSGLVIDASGNVYGTGAGGGAWSSGTLYRLSPPKTGKTWNSTVLHSFKPFTPGGDDPFADIVLGGGVLYGSTISGGTFVNCIDGCGTLFEFKL